MEETKASVTTEEEALKQVSGKVLQEFNALANLIGTSESADDFKLNLFHDNVQADGSIAALPADNIINIDLGKQSKNENLKKVAQDFKDIDLSAAKQKNTGQDLLDLMDDL